MDKMTKRDFIKTMLVGTFATSGLTFLGCSRKGKKLSEKLYVYNWANYISSRTIPDFEKEFNVKVIYDNYSNNEELLAKLQTGAGGYDVIFPSDYMVDIMRKQNLLEELDMKNIPNFKNISDRFKNLPFDPGNVYSIPYFWGTTGIGYNSEKITETVDSWKILWDEKYKGKISMLDDMRTLANPALKLLGYSINTTDPAKIKEAEVMLLKQKPLVKAYTSDTYIDFLVSGDIFLAHAYSGDTFQAIKENKKIKYVIPKEGSDIWIDNMCIPKGAKNKYTAEVFINYILRPKVSAEISNFTWYATPNEASREFINPEIINNKSIYPPDEVLDLCEYQRDLGPANKYYEQLYNKVKS